MKMNHEAGEGDPRARCPGCWAKAYRYFQPIVCRLRYAGHTVHSTERVLGILVLLIGTLASAHLAFANDVKLSGEQRMAILRTFLSERPFIHRSLPRGKAGVRIEGEKITPSDADMNLLLTEYGAVAKLGERVQITAIRFEHEGIVFDVNGGPVKRKSWRDRVTIGGINPGSSQEQPGSDSVYTESNGSSVFLAIKGDAATLTTDQIKDMLSPVLDFKAMSVAEAYMKSLPPVLAEAVKNHHALVGMDKEMVTYAMGRPPRRVREKNYEEWIYGNPPQDVQFIRFVEAKVVRIEDMKVSGEKVVRTQDEVGDLGGALSASSKKLPDAMAGSSPVDSRKPPTLLRPGEKAGNADGTQDSKRDADPKPAPDVPTGEQK